MSKSVQTLHLVPKPGEISMEFKDGRILRFHVPEDVTPLEAARLVELSTLIVFSGMAPNINIDRMAEEYGVERCITCGDKGLEYLMVPE